MYQNSVSVIDEDIWKTYKLTHSNKIRNDILMSYIYIVKCNVKKMNAVYRNHADLEDLINYGILVLMDCIEKFDPGRGVKFDTFASIRIRGSIIDYIRKQDWIPRSLRKKARDIEDAYSMLNIELGRQASDAEAAEHLGIDVDKLNNIIGQAHGFAVLSYEELLQENTVNIKMDNAFNKTPEGLSQENELKDIIAKSIDKLNENERTVVSLYYFEELKIKEIADVLGLTQSRISQIHSKALMKLKGMIKNYYED